MPKRLRDRARLRNPRIDYYAWKMEQTQEVLQQLLSESEAGVPIVVEGRRDEAALRKLGINGIIHCLKARGESRFEFLERLDGSDEAILLTDFDREGRELTEWLHNELSRRGVRSDFTLWRRIRSLARTEVHAVEELPSFIRALEARSQGLRQVDPQHPRR
ncbi:MAG TPA: toprim domain-containing protein [Candidatus Bathyarchaeia archaeon]|nr:toprim domain-containing protein [Candidatus Bathyarchaeia archaeon]